MTYNLPAAWFFLGIACGSVLLSGIALLVALHDDCKILIRMRLYKMGPDLYQLTLDLIAANDEFQGNSDRTSFHDKSVALAERARAIRDRVEGWASGREE